MRGREGRGGKGKREEEREGGIGTRRDNNVYKAQVVLIIMINYKRDILFSSQYYLVVIGDSERFHYNKLGQFHY